MVLLLECLNVGGSDEAVPVLHVLLQADPVQPTLQYGILYDIVGWADFHV